MEERGNEKRKGKGEMVLMMKVVMHEESHLSDEGIQIDGEGQEHLEIRDVQGTLVHGQEDLKFLLLLVHL